MPGLMSYIYLIIVIFLIGMFILSVLTDPDFLRIKPHSLSVIALILIVLNWILYLSGIYNLLPNKISDMIFLPIWVIVCIFGLFATYKEYENNLFVALLVGGLSVITLMLSGVLFIIG